MSRPRITRKTVVNIGFCSKVLSSELVGAPVVRNDPPEMKVAVLFVFGAKSHLNFTTKSLFLTRVTDTLVNSSALSY